MKIAFGCDHGGFIAKNAVLSYLKSKGHEVIDFGTDSEVSCNYPEFAEKVALSVVNKNCDLGILICGTGIGMSIVANKIKGIRCAHVTDLFSAEMTRKHNNANVLAMGARITSVEDIVKLTEKFITTEFEGERHELRVNMIKDVENKYFK